jgi:thiamine thiazole synthase
VVVKHAALFTSTVLSKVLRADNIKLFNAVSVEDLIVKQDPDGPEGERCVAGVVTNWATVTLFGHDTHWARARARARLSSKVVIGATGHDGPLGASVVKSLAKLGLLDKGNLNKDNVNMLGMGALDMNTAEDGVVEGTRELAPGIILTGMEVAESNGAARMGPTFGAMMISGRKVTDSRGVGVRVGVRPTLKARTLTRPPTLPSTSWTSTGAARRPRTWPPSRSGT